MDAIARRRSPHGIQGIAIATRKLRIELIRMNHLESGILKSKIKETSPGKK
jgi:hypothetical protein